jgi:hypothetical protein
MGFGPIGIFLPVLYDVPTRLLSGTHKYQRLRRSLIISAELETDER